MNKVIKLMENINLNAEQEQIGTMAKAMDTNINNSHENTPTKNCKKTRKRKRIAFVPKKNILK